MLIEYAGVEDREYLAVHDHHVTPQVLQEKIERQEILVLRQDAEIIGWLRFNYFWDSIPFMNMLHIEADFHGQGLGTRLVQFWEEEMRRRKYKHVMTSSLSNEQAQHLYRKLGYHDQGALLLPGEPLEIIFYKQLAKS